MDTIWVAIIAAGSAIVGSFVGAIPHYLQLRESRQLRKWEKKYEFLMNRRNYLDKAIEELETTITKGGNMAHPILTYLDIGSITNALRELADYQDEIDFAEGHLSSEQTILLGKLRAKVLSGPLELRYQVDQQIEALIDEL